MCARCHVIISVSSKLCNSCSEKEELRKKARYKAYDKTRADDRCNKFYKSSCWIRTRVSVLERDNYMCICCYKTTGKVVAGDTVHHILELREDWNKRCDKDNLVTVCASCHKRIHDCYKKDKDSKNKMIEFLLKILQ